MEHLATNNAGYMPMALSTANETPEEPAAVVNNIAADRPMQVATLFHESSSLLGPGENASTSTTPNIDATTSPTSIDVMEPIASPSAALPPAASPPAASPPAASPPAASPPAASPPAASPPAGSPAPSSSISPSQTITAEADRSSPIPEPIDTIDEIVTPATPPEPTPVEEILSTADIPPTITTDETLPDVSPSNNPNEGDSAEACSSPVTQTPTPLSSPQRTAEAIEPPPPQIEPTDALSPSEPPVAATSPQPPLSDYKIENNENNEANNNNNNDDEAGATADDSERCLDELMDSAVADEREAASLHSDPSHQHHDPHHHHHHHHHNAQHHHPAMFRDMADDVTATMQPSYDQLNIQHIDQQQRDYLPEQHQMHHHHHHQMHNHQMQNEQLQHHQQQQIHPQQQQQQQHQQHHHMQQQLHHQQQQQHHQQQQQQHHAVHQDRLLDHPHHHHHHHQMDQQQLQSHHQQQQQMDHQQHQQMDQQQYKLYNSQYLPPINGYTNMYSGGKPPLSSSTFKPYRMSPVLKTESQDHGYETSSGLSAGGNNSTDATGPSLPASGESIMSPQHSSGGGNNTTGTGLVAKCEMPPPTPEDPYNFVDDEMSSSGGGGTGDTMSPHQLLSPGGSSMSGPTNRSYALGKLLPAMHTNLHGIHSPGLLDATVDGEVNAIASAVSSATPKKRGRKKKVRETDAQDNSETSIGPVLNGMKPTLAKERKKHDRFNGTPEEEVSKRTLPDHLAPNLDIIIIGINPGLFAAYKGHHYAGPGNHFWKCLYLSGLTHEQMSADEDYKLLDFGIGFTNMVERATKGSADLTRKEIKEGCRLLQDKLRRFRPKIAVFNGKLIFEVFSGKKDFNFGRQPECIEGTNTYMWVMPSSSARCAQLPRAADKVPFYAALKKFRDYLNGHISHMDEAECVFTDPKFKACYETDAKPDVLIGANATSFADITDISNSGVNSAMTPTTVIGSQISPAPPIHIGVNPVNHQMGGSVHSMMGGGGGGDDIPGKKKRGRPKKIRLADGEEPKITPPRRTPAQQQLTLDGEMPKKKRGRPKKIKSDMMNVMDMSGGGGGGGAALQSAGPPGMDPSTDVMMGMCSSLNANRMFPMHQQQQQQQTPSQHQQLQSQHQQNPHQHHHQQQQHHQQNHQNQQQHQQHHLLPHQQHSQNSPNPNPFGPIGQQQQHLQHQSSSTPPMRYGSMLMSTGSIPSPNDLSGLQSYHHQQQSSPQHQQFTHSDLSSEISAAISTSEQHLGGSIGGGGALSTGVGTTKSPAQTPPNQHCSGQSDFDNTASGSIHDENNTSNDCGPNNAGSTGGFASPAPSTHSEHGGISHLQQQQHNASYSPYRSTPNSVYMDQRTNESNDGYMQPQVSAGGRLHTVMEQQQQQQQQDSPHHTHGGADVYKLPDVASKSLSGLESLVDQIPNLNDSESASSNSSLTAVGGSGVIHGLNETRMHDTSGSTAASLSEQYQTSCLYGGYSSGLNDSMLAAGAGGSVNPPIGGASAPHYPSAQFSPQNSIGCGSPTVPPLTAHHPIAGPQQQQQQQTYAGLSSPFSVSSLTASANYPTAATMNSYHSNLLAAHHGGGGGGGGGASGGSGMLNGGAAPPSMYMEPHMPMPVNPLYHHPAYGQHGGYSGYGPVVAAPPPTIHMPSPNYPYGYGNAGAYGQPTHHPAAGHPATGYLANHHHSIFDRIKPDIGYGGF